MMDPLDDCDSEKVEDSVDDLLKNLPLDVPEMDSIDSSISEDIKQILDDSDLSGKEIENASVERHDIQKTSEPTQIYNALPGDNSTKFAATKTPLNSPTHVSKEFNLVTFELQLSPEIKFNINEIDYEKNRSLNEEVGSTMRCSRKFHSLVNANETKIVLNKKSASLDDANGTVVPMLDLKSVIPAETCKTAMQNENEHVPETPSAKDETNTPKTMSQCQYSNSNADQNYSMCDANLMQSLLNSIDTGTTSTEYKALCEEFTARQNLDYQSALNEKDQYIQTLTQSLQESMEMQKELDKDISKLHIELNDLRKKLTEVENSKSPSKESPPTESVEEKYDEEEDVMKVLQSAHISRVLVNNDLQKFAKDLTPIQRLEFDDIKYKFQILQKHEKNELQLKYEEQIHTMQETSKKEKQELENEISRLRQALCEFKDSGTDILQIKEHLQEQHKKEVEDLRTYFEKKCADMEKNYSEEIFSQQSRRVSADSSVDGDIGDLLYNPDLPDKYQGNNVITSLENEEVGGGDAMNQEHIQVPLENKKKSVSLVQNQHMEVFQSVFDDNLAQITAKHVSQLKTIELQFIYELVALKFDLTKEQDSQKVDMIKEILDQTEHQLQEQVELVRLDILNIFENQLETLHLNTLDNESAHIDTTANKDKSTEDSQQEIMKLKTTHQNEILKLRNDYEKQLNRKLQRNSSFDKNRNLDEIFKEKERERNSLLKVNRTLHLLITELMSYVTNCETEINNAFWNKLETLNQLCDNTTTEEDESILNVSNLNITASSDLNQSCVSKFGGKHVHFAPDITQFLDQLKDDSIIQDLEIEKNVTVDLKTELNNCLDRLRTEASALLHLTSTTKPSGNSKHHNIYDEKNGNLEKLDERERERDILSRVEDLENEKQDIITKLMDVEREREELKVQLATATSKNEIISEGYGGHSPIRNLLVKQSTFSELRQKANALLSAPLNESADMANTPLLQLFEEICREGDRIYDESTQDRDDLQLQIEAADKQLRSTRQFLEDQAAEREQERDDFTREISELKAKLKDRDKERHIHDTALKELDYDVVERKIEQLEGQMRQMTLTISEEAKKKCDLESELKASVDKIYLLSDIIRELENQLETKSLNEKHNERQIIDLHNINEELHKKYESLTKELLTAQNQPDVNLLNEKICNLEDQLHNHRQTTENTAAVLEVKKELDDIGSSIDAKTKQLEALHAAVYSTSCSSEDVSIGNRIISKKNSSIHDQNDVLSPDNKSTPVDVLDHLQIIQDKLARHWRVEDAALKQIRDLEMQVTTLKHAYSELKNEKDLLQERSQQQIIDLSSLQSRLDDQRRRADSIHKQSTSDLHLQIHNLQSDLASTKEQLLNKNRRIQTLEHIVEESRVKTTPDHSSARDIKLSNEGFGNDDNNEKPTISLIEARLEKKDAEIIELKEKLNRTLHELESFLQLQLSEEEIKKIRILKEKRDKQNGAKLSARTLSDIVSISEYDELDIIRKDDTRFDADVVGSIHKPDLNYSPPFNFSNFNLMTQDDIQFVSGESCNKNVIDTDDHEKCIDLRDGSPVMQQKLDLIPENEECSISEQNNIEYQLENEIKHLKSILRDKAEELTNYKLQLASVPMLEEEMKKLRENLHETLKTIEDDKIRFEKLIQSENEVKEQILNLQCDIKKKSEENNSLVETLHQKDVELTNLMFEKQDIQKVLDDLTAEYKNYDQIVQENKNLKDKLSDIDALQVDLFQKKSQIEKSQKDLLEKNQELLTLRDYTELLKQTIKEKTDLLNDLNQKANYHQLKIQEQSEHIEKLTYELNHFKCVSEFPNNELEIAYKNELKDRDEQILHFKELLEEKEKIIGHISKDSDNLHSALATIQNKLKESGNILDLAVKLKNELKKNESLVIEVEQLREVVTRLENNASLHHVDDIEKQVQKELDESIKLDNRLIKAIENDDFISDGNDQNTADKQLTNLISQNEVLQIKLDEEIKRNIKLMVSKQTLLLDLKSMEDRLRKGEQINTKLQKELQQEMDKNNEIQTQDAAIMEAMRLRLEKALDKESMAKKICEQNEMMEKDGKTDFSSDPLSKEIYEELLLEVKSLRKELSVQYASSDKLYNEIVLLKAQIKSEKNKLHDAERLITKEREEFHHEISHKNRLLEEIIKDLGNLKEHKSKLVRELYESNQRSIKQCDRIASLESNLKTLQLTEICRNQNRGKEKEEQRATNAKYQQLLNIDGTIECENVVSKALNEKKSSASIDLLNKLKEVSTSLEEHTLENKNIPSKLECLDYVSLDSYQNAIDKINHLFSKCMRSESYRKALTWQKGYLMRVQRSYELAEKRAMSQMNMVVKKQQHLSPIQKFRTSIFAVIAINRMQYLVRRWDAGRVTTGKISHSGKFYKARLREKASIESYVQKHK